MKAHVQGGTMRILLGFIVVGLLSITSVDAGKSPFSIQVLNSKEKLNHAPGILQRDSLIQRIAPTEGTDFYLLRMDSQHDFPETELAKFGSVLHYDEGNFAILHFDSEMKREALAGVAHGKTHACGNLQLIPNKLDKDGSRKTVDPILPIERSGAIYERVQSIADQVQISALVETMRTMVSWETRFHGSFTGKDTALKLGELYQAVLPADRDDVEITLVRHQRTEQRSLVVRIRGTEEPEKLVLLGSHLDAINRSTGNRFTPGADDNASGTSTNLEIFRLLMVNGIRPKRTIEIQAYGAEEIGLVGSAEIARQYKETGKQVQTMVQFDMNAYNSNGVDKIWLVSNNTNRNLTTTLGELVDTYVGLPWATKELWAGGSDHMSWNSNGFAAAFPTENPTDYNRAIHTSRDTMDVAVATTQMAGHTKLGLAYILHFAGISGI